MTLAFQTTPEADRIQRSIDARVAAIRNKNVEALMGAYATNVSSFDLLPPLAHNGASAVKHRVAEWFDSFSSHIDYQIRDMTLHIAGDVAFDHHYTHVRGLDHSGGIVDMWFRETVGYRKIGGKWKITHQHSSVPIDMSTGKGILGLQP